MLRVGSNDKSLSELDEMARNGNGQMAQKVSELGRLIYLEDELDMRNPVHRPIRWVCYLPVTCPAYAGQNLFASPSLFTRPIALKMDSVVVSSQLNKSVF
jgi:hypothetical protein